MNIQNSKNLYNQALQCFPGGVNSPVRAFKSVYGTPIFIAKGNGCYIFDEDGNQFIDFCCSWGPLILGHNNPIIKTHIIEALEKGTSFGAPTRYEVALAELILQNNPYIEKLRFVSSGTEAVMSAIRLARGYTQRDKIVKFEGCYHGHVDSLLVKAGSGLVTFGETTSAGIPAAFAEQTIVLPLNDLNALENTFKHIGNQIAAIIIEPIPANNGLLLQPIEFLNALKTYCNKYGALLIFDEVISGFRVGFQGAANYYNIKPDIITYGKIIGGGMPVGAYGANKTIMAKIAPDGNVYQAGTLSGNPVAMAAGFAQLSQCLQPNFYTDLEQKTNFFVHKINLHCQQNKYPMQLISVASIFWISYTQNATPITAAEQIDATKMVYFKELHKYCLENGVYLAPSGYEVGFISQAHTYTDLEHAANIINKAFDVIFAK